MEKYLILKLKQDVDDYKDMIEFYRNLILNGTEKQLNQMKQIIQKETEKNGK